MNTQIVKLFLLCCFLTSATRADAQDHASAAGKHGVNTIPTPVKSANIPSPYGLVQLQPLEAHEIPVLQGATEGIWPRCTNDAFRCSPKKRGRYRLKQFIPRVPQSGLGPPSLSGFTNGGDHFNSNPSSDSSATTDNDAFWSASSSSGAPTIKDAFWSGSSSSGVPTIHDTFTTGSGRPSLTWKHFPVRIYFSSSLARSGKEHEIDLLIQRCFDRWIQASTGRISYIVTDDFLNCDVLFRQDLTSDHDWAECTREFRSGNLNRVTVTVLDESFRQLSAPQLESVLMHQVGHVLGIETHHQAHGNVMALDCNEQVPPAISLSINDQASLRQLYH